MLQPRVVRISHGEVKGSTRGTSFQDLEEVHFVAFENVGVFWSVDVKSL
jgi:hypothetical protein